jgi:hypothetical protein
VARLRADYPPGTRGITRVLKPPYERRLKRHTEASVALLQQANACC